MMRPAQGSRWIRSAKAVDRRKRGIGITPVTIANTKSAAGTAGPQYTMVRDKSCSSLKKTCGDPPEAANNDKSRGTNSSSKRSKKP